MTGPELRARREALGLSQEALAKRLGVTGRTIWRWEHEVYNAPHPLLAERLERLLARLERAQKEGGHGMKLDLTRQCERCGQPVIKSAYSAEGLDALRAEIDVICQQCAMSAETEAWLQWRTKIAAKQRADAEEELAWEAYITATKKAGEAAARTEGRTFP